MRTAVNLGVRVEDGLYQELTSFCTGYGIPISKVLCEGAVIYMKLAQGKTPLERRKLERDEFTVLALEHLMNDQYPAVTDALYEEAARRAEAFNVAA